MITSTSNAKIKHVVTLVSSARDRKKEGVFIVEGVRMFAETPHDLIQECYATESFAIDNSIPADIKYEIVSDAVFQKMSDTKSPQGILCVVKKQSTLATDFLKEHEEGKLKLLVLENIQDPGNLGTMVRTCEAAGFDAIIASADTVDVYNPKVTRSTMGAIFRVPIMYVDDMGSVVDLLKSMHVSVCAAHLQGKCNYDEAQYTDRTAILIGNEGNGLSDEISLKSDILVKIPMAGQVESLNAAVAAALMMYEVRKY